jgi:hypothetical protein
VRQKNLLEYLNGEAEEEHKCPVCGRSFQSTKSLNQHFTRKHVFKLGEGVELHQIDGERFIMKVTMSAGMVDTLVKTLMRAGVELDNFLSECFMFGDSLFDKDIKPLIEEKAASRILPILEREGLIEKPIRREQPRYIS